MNNPSPRKTTQRRKRRRRKPRKLPVVRQCLIDPQRLLPRPIRREVATLLNELRRREYKDIPVVIRPEKLYLIELCNQAIREQGLTILRKYQVHPRQPRSTSGKSDGA